MPQIVIHQPTDDFLQRNAHYLLEVEHDDVQWDCVECTWVGNDFKLMKPLHNNNLFIPALETLNGRLTILSIRKIV